MITGQTLPSGLATVTFFQTKLSHYFNPLLKQPASQHSLDPDQPLLKLKNYTPKPTPHFISAFSGQDSDEPVTAGNLQQTWDRPIVRMRQKEAKSAFKQTQTRANQRQNKDPPGYDISPPPVQNIILENQNLRTAEVRCQQGLQFSFPISTHGQQSKIWLRSADIRTINPEWLHNLFISYL